MTSRVEPLGDDAGELGVSWKRTTAVPFAMIAGLVNPLNGTPVVQSPDCAELATPVGMQLTHIVCNAPPRDLRRSRRAPTRPPTRARRARRARAGRRGARAARARRAGTCGRGRASCSGATARPRRSASRAAIKGAPPDMADEGEGHRAGHAALPRQPRRELVFGLFEAASPVGFNAEPAAFNPQPAKQPSPLPVQVRVRRSLSRSLSLSLSTLSLGSALSLSRGGSAGSSPSRRRRSPTSSRARGAMPGPLNSGGQAGGGAPPNRDAPSVAT